MHRMGQRQAIRSPNRIPALVHSPACRSRRHRRDEAEQRIGLARPCSQWKTPQKAMSDTLVPARLRG
jgi:hypothetical protein